MDHPNLRFPDSTAPRPERPLAGLRVIDFTSMIAGPYCTRWLADLGASVIKVEAPGGDVMRGRPPLREQHSAFFGHMNGGKRCIALDLKKPQAVAIAQRLVDDADVMIEAFRPGVIARLGLGAAAMRARNPRLVYCSISGYGQSTGVAQRPAYAPVVHATSGYDWVLSGGAGQTPRSSTVPLADILTGMFATQAIQAALLHRQASGQGTVIDVNLMDSVMNVLPFEFQAAQFGWGQPRPTYWPLRCADGHVLVTPINTRNYQNLCVAMGHPEWIDDPLLAADAARFANWDEYMRRIEAWTSTRDGDECERILADQGVPCARYRSIEEAMRDPQFAERDSFAEVRDAVGPFQVTRLPYALGGQRPATGASVAAVGAHTREVLDELGCTAAEIDALLASKAALA